MTTDIDTGSHADQRAREVRPFVHAFFRRRTRNSEHAEDLTQDVLLSLVRHQASFRGDCPVKHWALRIAVARLKNYYARDLHREAALEPWDSEATWPSDDTTALDAVLSDDVVKTIVERARSVCSRIEFRAVMFCYHGRSMEEIASLEQIPPATARSHLLRARKKLLADLVCNHPELVGGTAAIEAALQRLSESERPATEKEMEAWRKKDSRSEAVRELCLKLARQLSPLACLLLLIMRFPNER